jgi:hypothetical protein
MMKVVLLSSAIQIAAVVISNLSSLLHSLRMILDSHDCTNGEANVRHLLRVYPVENLGLSPGGLVESIIAGLRLRPWARIATAATVQTAATRSP